MAEFSDHALGVACRIRSGYLWPCRFHAFGIDFDVFVSPVKTGRPVRYLFASVLMSTRGTTIAGHL